MKKWKKKKINIKRAFEKLGDRTKIVTKRCPIRK